MTIEDLGKFFEDNEDERMKDDRIDSSRRLHPRRDLDVFLRLDRLVSGNRRIVSGAEHDKIFLCFDLGEVVSAATTEDLIDLIRCGVLYDDEDESLFMFV